MYDVERVIFFGIQQQVEIKRISSNLSPKSEFKAFHPDYNIFTSKKAAFYIADLSSILEASFPKMNLVWPGLPNSSFPFIWMFGRRQERPTFESLHETFIFFFFSHTRERLKYLGRGRKDRVRRGVYVMSTTQTFSYTAFPFSQEVHVVTKMNHMNALPDQQHQVVGQYEKENSPSCKREVYYLEDSDPEERADEIQ